MVTESQYDALQKEILGLFENIQRFKQELASVKHPTASQDLIGTAGDQITAISDETTRATDDIMAAAEAIEKVNGQLRTEIKFAGARPLFKEIGDSVNHIFEACAFHDITGQRLTKVVSTINAIESALSAMVAIVGKDSIAALPSGSQEINRRDGDVELTGPQGDDGLSQDDIDKLFD